MEPEGKKGNVATEVTSERPRDESNVIEMALRAWADPARIATLIHDALRKSDPSAFMDDDPLQSRLTIDGHFNLVAVSKMLLFDLITNSRLGMPK
jgi:hypothetical protein